VAIIMDGNGRWAKKRLLPRVAGHHRGVETVRATVKTCLERGIEYLTLFAFSVPRTGVARKRKSRLLMQLFVRALKAKSSKLHRNGVRLRVVGDLSRFEPELQALIAKPPRSGRQQRRLTLTIAANYGGRWDILQAVNRMLSSDPEKRGNGRRKRSGATSGDELCTGARSVHPHRWRAADQQLPALATRVFRVVFHRGAVARI
jgi:undecaprenyl diphosphate synthase